jgi:hypothetical protein
VQRYTTDVPKTASELFDGELVIADYGSGLYYALSPSATLVWQALGAGLGEGEVVTWLAGHAVLPRDDLAAQVRGVIKRLLDEGLLLPIDAPAAAGTAARPAPPAVPFAAPQIERFSDLQELMLLDPVHDVADAGWPHRADSSEQR